MSNSPNRNLLILSLCFVWLLLVSLAYGYTHKPFSLQMFLAICRDVWILILAIFLMSAAATLGQEILKLFFLSADFPSEIRRTSAILTITWPVALGMGIFSLVVLAAGTFFAANPWVFGLLLVILVAWQWRRMFEFWRQVGHAWQELAPVGKAEKLLTLLVTIIVLFNLSVALAPPLTFDALVYHLTLPLRYLQEGRITYIPEIMFWGMPQLAEMHYLVMLALGGKSAPAVLSWLVGILTLLALGDDLRQRFDRLTAWFAIAALLSGFTLSHLLGAAYLEWFLLFYGLAWWQLLEAIYKHGKKEVLVTLLGIVSGFALSLKYTAGVLLLLGILALLFQPDGQWQRNTYRAFKLGLVAMLVSLPWWVKNFTWTGNPFYPILLPAGAMDAIRYDFYHNVLSDLKWYQGLVMPWYITIWGVDGKVGPSASIGPLLLAFWPLAYLGWRNRTDSQRQSLILATLILLGGFVLWVLVAFRNNLLVQTRLFITLFPMWVILASAGFAHISQVKVASVRFGRILLTFVVLFLSFNVFETLSDVLPKQSLDYNFGLLSQEDYLAHNLGDFYAVSETIRNFPPGSRIIMLWETRGFYCVPRCEPDEIIDRWYHETHLHGTAHEILSAWIEQGYTHLLIWESGFKFVRDTDANLRFTQRDWDLLEKLRAILGRGQQMGSYILYPLR
jgi:hypothetical protein